MGTHKKYPLILGNPHLGLRGVVFWVYGKPQLKGCGLSRFRVGLVDLCGLGCGELTGLEIAAVECRLGA